MTAPLGQVQAAQHGVEVVEQQRGLGALIMPSLVYTGSSVLVVEDPGAGRGAEKDHK